MRLLLLAVIMTSATTTNCPLPTQRYDVAEFPPRCIDCPQIVSNQMPLARIATQLAVQRAAVKFSPGLPQNDTCGCWRAANQTVVNVTLNASWIVSGLLWDNDRGRWLRQVSVRASEDGVVFVGLGNYTYANHTAAAVMLFAAPVRARVFEVSVLRYANHYVNTSTGFALAAPTALVSQTQPFTCACPLLANGSCCPYLNMTVRNDTCVWCMDPTQISTVMVDGCGKCRAGTFEYMGRCVYSLPSNAINNMRVAAPQSDGVFWTADIDISADPRTVVLLYLTSRGAAPHPCLSNQTVACFLTPVAGFLTVVQPSSWKPAVRQLPPLIAPRYIQFDRGRYTLNMTQPTVREWAAACSLGALFITLWHGRVLQTAALQQPLILKTGIPSLVLSGPGTESLMRAQMELHLFPGNVWMVRVVGATLVGATVRVQWDEGPVLVYGNSPQYIAIGPPPPNWSQMRVSDGSTRLEIRQPVYPVVHGALDSLEYSGIVVEMKYGLRFSAEPSPGDSEQLIFITARSPLPVRLKSLAASIAGATVHYTTSKGFISDPTRVVDLTLACITPPVSSTLYAWIYSAIQILPDAPLLGDYIQRSCAMVTSGAVTKAYWLVPAVAAPRSQPLRLEVTAEFA